MAELAAASQLLKPKVTADLDRSEEQNSPKLTANTIWAVPTQLLAVPEWKHAAEKAIDSGKAAYQDPENVENTLQACLDKQELAAIIGTISPSDQATLLRSACEIYQLAFDICGARGLHGRLPVLMFNWAVGLSDLARLSKLQDELEEYARLLTQAIVKYAQAIDLDPSNAQALNNVALALSDLAPLASTHQEQEILLKASLSRFRAAIRLQSYDSRLTSRFCYNLGTVLYAHACSLGKRDGPDRGRYTFSHAASYIMLAYALQPGVKVYEDSLTAVQRLLPLPNLRTGIFQVQHPARRGSLAEQWVSAYFTLDSHTLQAVRPPSAEAHRVTTGAIPTIAVDISSIASAQVCLDPSLPLPGIALYVALKDSSDTGIYFVVQDREVAEGWVDCLQLLGILCRMDDGQQRLAEALIARRKR